MEQGNGKVRQNQGKQERRFRQSLLASAIALALLPVVPPVMADDINGNGSEGKITVDHDVNGNVYGWYYDDATPANGGEVTMNGGTVSQGIYGGYSYRGEATGNTVTVTGGAIGNAVYGGFSADTGAATGNTVILEGHPDHLSLNDVYGGYSDGQGTITDNILQVKTTGVNVQALKNFDQYEFYIPNNASTGTTMLTVTGGDQTDLGAARVGVAVAAGAKPALAVGDTLTLIHNDKGFSSNNGITPIDLSGKQGISLDYTFHVPTLNEAGTDLQASVASVKAAPETVIFNDGRLASLGFINRGNDLARETGLGQIGKGKTGLYGAISGSDNRHDTGHGHADASGTHWLIGAAGKLKQDKAAEATGTLYLQAGWGDIKERNPAARGQGDTHYYGIGATGHYRQKEGILKGTWLQLNGHLGRAGTDFDSDLRDSSGKRGSYDKKANYYGAGIELGYTLGVTETAELDISAGYQWTRLEGYHTRIAGDPYRFDDIDSHRSKVGAKLKYKADSQYTPYAGLAWEHEFSGTARGSVYGYRLEESSLKGDTGIGEIGVEFSPEAESPWRVDAKVQGYMGRMEGVAGHLEVNYRF